MQRKGRSNTPRYHPNFSTNRTLLLCLTRTHGISYYCSSNMRLRREHKTTPELKSTFSHDAFSLEEAAVLLRLLCLSI